MLAVNKRGGLEVSRLMYIKLVFTMAIDAIVVSHKSKWSHAASGRSWS